MRTSTTAVNDAPKMAGVHGERDNAAARVRVIEYYDQCGDDYRILWRTDENQTIHYGFFDEPGARSSLVEVLSSAVQLPLRLSAAALAPAAALAGPPGGQLATRLLRYAARGRARRHDLAQLRMTQVCADSIGMTRGDRVLDAGCGLGGAALWNATARGGRVIGVNVQRRHLQAAVRHAQHLAAPLRPIYVAQDYTQLGLKDRTFDVVWGLESICHCAEKADFLREAFRVLRPGGRLMVADFFATREPLEPEAAARQKVWLDGWAIPNLATMPGFAEAAVRAGFRDVACRDIRDHVMPSARRLFKASVVAYPVGLLLQRLRVRDAIHTANIRAARYQYLALQESLWTYGIVTATKPARPDPGDSRVPERP